MLYRHFKLLAPANQEIPSKNSIKSFSSKSNRFPASRLKHYFPYSAFREVRKLMWKSIRKAGDRFRYCKVSPILTKILIPVVRIALEIQDRLIQELEYWRFCFFSYVSQPFWSLLVLYWLVLSHFQQVPPVMHCKMISDATNFTFICNLIIHG